ncbi:MAG TPA: DUF6569 family protein [Gaiellaceae bacterium]|nr:DUF6569 family protein [Gaiellaceae bacterium]
MTTLTHVPTLPFELGEPASFAGLTLVPLFAAAAPRFDYLGLDEGAARGLLVTEAFEEGAVQSLLVTNPLDERVLLYEGEELVGAKQNRILARTILVEARAKLPVPVSCVERGRWSYRTRDFAAAPRAAYPELRRVRHDGGGQAQVWSAVAAKSARLDVASPTEAAEAMYASRRHSLDEYLSALPRRDGQCGAIVVIGGRLVCLDFVGRSDVFAGLYPKLLRGYALDAIERPVEAPLPRAFLRSFLRSLDDAPRRAQGTVGAGEERRFRGRRAVGSELRVDGELVALTAFPA